MLAQSQGLAAVLWELSTCLQLDIVHLDMLQPCWSRRTCISSVKKCDEEVGPHPTQQCIHSILLKSVLRDHFGQCSGNRMQCWACKASGYPFSLKTCLMERLQIPCLNVLRRWNCERKVCEGGMWKVNRPNPDPGTMPQILGDLLVFTLHFGGDYHQPSQKALYKGWARNMGLVLP